MSTYKKMKLNYFPYTTLKINSKQINKLNKRIKVIKILEETTGLNVHNLEFGSGFLDMAPKPWVKITTTKIDNWT